MEQQKQIRLGTMKFRIRSLASLSGLRIRHYHGCGVDHRCGSDLALLWLWRRPATTALIRPPYAASAALKRQKKKKKKKMCTEFSVWWTLVLFIVLLTA